MASPTNISRRRFLKLMAASSAAGLSGITYSWQIEPRRLVVREHTLPISRLPTAFDGFRIVQLSDLHIDPQYRYGFIAEAVATANDLNPDLVVLTGDYITQDASAMPKLASYLAELQANHGIYAIFGNHDVWGGKRGTVQTAFQQVGIPLLNNTHVILSQSDEKLILAGLDDGWGGRPDLNTALHNTPDNPVVLLLHEPDLIEQHAHDPRIILQLSGHSHGGQIRLPNVGALYLPRYGQKYDYGLYKVGNIWLNTNAGLGMTSYGLTTPPVRFNCPPEISLMIL
ncbi:MAG: metallophosphoesterase, partial [Deinococcota bacterium]